MGKLRTYGHNNQAERQDYRAGRRHSLLRIETPVCAPCVADGAAVPLRPAQRVVAFQRHLPV